MDGISNRGAESLTDLDGDIAGINSASLNP